MPKSKGVYKRKDDCIKRSELMKQLALKPDTFVYIMINDDVIANNTKKELVRIPRIVHLKLETVTFEGEQIIALRAYSERGKS